MDDLVRFLKFLYLNNILVMYYYKISILSMLKKYILWTLITFWKSIPIVRRQTVYRRSEFEFGRLNFWMAGINRNFPYVLCPMTFRVESMRGSSSTDSLIIHLKKKMKIKVQSVAPCNISCLLLIKCNILLCLRFLLPKSFYEQALTASSNFITKYLFTLL